MPGSVAKAPLKVSEFYAPPGQSSAWKAYNQSFHGTLFPAVGAYPTTGLVSYWTLDEASGTRFDSCGSNDLTDNNTVTSATGIQGNDAFFTAANSQYLSCASNASLQVTGDFTIACWVKLTTHPSGGDFSYKIVAKDSDVPSSNDYTLDYTEGAAPNGFRFYQNYNGISTSVAYSGGSPVSTGVWTHVVAIYDSASGFCSVRLNDTTTFTAVSANTAMVQSAAEFRIGARVYAGSNDFMDGEIDEVGFWKRKLTSTEITSLYHGGVGVTYSVATLTRQPLKSLGATLFQSGAALATDNFNRANGALGANWGSVTGLFDFTLNTNRADTTNGGNEGARYTAVVAPVDQYSKCTVTSLNSSTSTGIGPAVRMASGAVTMYLLQGNTTETTMFKAVAGSFTQLGSTAAASAVNDVLEIDAVGTTITGKKNGVVIIGPVTDSAIGSGNFGIWASATGVTISLDNWEGGTPGGGPLATLTRTPFKSLSATFSPVAALTRKYLDAGFTATLSFVGNLTKGLLYLRSFSATLFGPTGDGTPVSTWTDSSGNGHNATQSGSARPTLKTNIINGKPVVRFDSSSTVQSLVLSSSVSGTASGPWTVIALIKPVNTSLLICSISGSNGIFGPNAFSTNWFTGLVGNKWQFNATNTAAHVVSADTTAAFYDNGTSQTGVSFAAGPTGDFSTIGLRAGTADAADGDIAEVIVYNSVLSSTDRANVEKYLGVKYAVTVAGGSAVDPSTITGLQAWFKADSLIPPTATLTRSAFKSLAATFAPTAALSRRLAKSVTATLTSTAVLTKKYLNKGFTAALSFIGNLAVLKIFVRALTATLSFSGALSRRTGKALTATFSFIGNLATNLIHGGGTLFTQSFTATLSFVGAFVKLPQKNFVATLSLNVPIGLATGYFRSLRIDHTKVPSTQANFPVLVSITDPTLKTAGNGGHVQNVNGYDIGFYSDSLGTTKLKWEIERYDGVAGTVVAWVNIGSLSSSADTTFYIFYGNPSIVTDQSDQVNTWDANFKAVWHMGDNAATTIIRESTATGATATNIANTSTKTATAQVDGGLAYNGTTDASSAALDLSATKIVTLSFWMNWTTNANDDHLALEYTPNYNASNGGFLVDWNYSGVAGTSAFGFRVGGLLWNDRFTRPSAGGWHLIHLVMNQNTPVNKAYVDGVLQTLTAITHAAAAGGFFANSTLYFMSRATTTLFGAGTLDEVKLSITERSQDWITTEYNNQSAPGTFISLGSENIGFTRKTLKFLNSTLSSTGAVLKAIRDGGFSATLSFVGTLGTAVVHFFTKAFTATLSFAGAITTSRRFARALSATLNFTGTLRRQLGKSLLATLNFSAALRKTIRKGFSATLSFIGFLFRGGAVEIIAGVITGALVRMGLAGSSARIGQAGSQLEIRETTSEADSPITGSSLRVERTK